MCLLWIFEVFRYHKVVFEGRSGRVCVEQRFRRSGRAIVLCLLTLCCMGNGRVGLAGAEPNPIQIENSRPGTQGWELLRPADDRGMQIKAFASQTSVSGGDSLEFYVTTVPAQRYRMRIYRMGYYAGIGARQVYQSDWQEGEVQPDCLIDSQTGLTQCGWNLSLQVLIDRSWTTGIYLAKFENEAGFDSYVIFALKDDQRLPDFVYQQPVTTYQAYNAFPDDGVNGKSAYDAFSYGPPTIAGSARAVRLSYSRPLENTGAERFFMHEHDLIMFLEERGYDIGYQTNIDTHFNPDRISEAKAFISPGHDEYWTDENFRAVELARENGVHLAFFGANTAFWQIRLVNDTALDDGLVMDIYKDASIDPEPMFTNKTVTFRSLGRPEQSLVGVQYVTYATRRADADFIVNNADHWIYQDTGLADNDRIVGIVGIEVDRIFTDVELPDSTEFDVIGRSPFTGADSPVPTVSEAVVYRSASGAWVFASGTLLWGQGLNRPGLRSEPLRTMTQNLLDRYADIDDTLPTLSIQPVTVPESVGDVSVAVRLSSASDTPVRFSLATRQGTAQEGVDYYGVYEIATIDAGQTSRTIPVTIVDDDVAEQAEAFYARIFNVVGAEVELPEATVTIAANDTEPVVGISISSEVASESDRVVTLSVALDRSTELPVQVEFATDQRSASRGVDYYGRYGVLLFGAGESRKTIDIKIRDDDERESTETFVVRLFRAVGAKIVQSTATVTLLDDEGG